MDFDWPGVNYFNLSLSPPSSSFDSRPGPPFTVTGTSNHFDNAVLNGVKFNMSNSNGDETWWGTHWQSVSVAHGLSDPEVAVTFDEGSVHFTLEGFVGPLPRGARSDVLDEGSTPTWTRTLGFGTSEENLDFGGENETAGNTTRLGKCRLTRLVVVPGGGYL
ncbi:hypothetical protein BJX62DRAFT_236263 [Aspergillus germanicus]